jgi:adenylyltransferase/sulfurtransferase
LSAISNSKPPDIRRYARQTVLPAIGKDGQKSLSSSRVSILGVGALGTNSASLLARSGVGFIRLVDREYIDISNLNRQNLFDEADIRSGCPKAVMAAKKLAAVNSTISLEPRVVDMPIP